MHGHAFRPVLAVILLLAAAVLPACTATYSNAGSSETLTEYHLGTLKADLPPSVRIPAVMAAGQATLRHRGYSVSSSRITADAGRIEGESPSSSPLGSASVWAEAVPTGTRVGVKVGLWGDEDASRSILDDMLRRVGL